MEGESVGNPKNDLWLITSFEVMLNQQKIIILWFMFELYEMFINSLA